MLCFPLLQLCIQDEMSLMKEEHEKERQTSKVNMYSYTSNFSDCYNTLLYVNHFSVHRYVAFIFLI